MQQAISIEQWAIEKLHEYLSLNRGGVAMVTFKRLLKLEPDPRVREYVRARSQWVMRTVRRIDKIGEWRKVEMRRYKVFFTRVN